MKKKLWIGALAALLVVGLLMAQVPGKYLGFTADRFWKNDGSIRTDNVIETFGASNKFRLSYSEGVYTDVVENSSGTIYIDKNQTTETGRVVHMNSNIAGTVESRNGMLYVYGSRPLGYASSSWGGSPDMGIKVHVRNYAVNGVAGGATRAAEFMASQRNTGTTCDLWGGLFNAESLSGTSTHGIYGLQVSYDQSGNVNTEHAGLWVHDNSQSDVGTNYGIKLYTATYAQTRENAIWVGSQGGSWTNGLSFNDAVTNALVFEDADFTNAANYDATIDDQDTNPDGNIKVVIGGHTLYLYAYANAAHKN